MVKERYCIVMEGYRIHRIKRHFASQDDDLVLDERAIVLTE